MILIALLAVVVQDDLGHRLTLPHPAARIVSTAPGATEMLFAAGAGHQVVATVEYSIEPPEARKVPRIGDGMAIDIEGVVALHPDVVVVWPGGGNPAQVEKLRKLKFPLYRQEANTLADMAPSLRRLGALAGTQAVAEVAARDMESRLARLRAAHPAGRGPLRTVLLQVWDRPIYTVGGRQLMSDALRYCGARNVFDDLTEMGPAVDVESVLARDPEFIVAIAPPGSAQAWLNDWRRFPQLRAVREHHLIGMVEGDLTRLGPSAMKGAEVLCKRLDEKRSLTPGPSLLHGEGGRK
jgi:iron complex transport system substrate-binding protein